jgi:Uma2 family endonuclease
VRWPLERVPRPEDIQLVVEVSDTTLTRDQRQKLPLYAAAGISECWIVDLPHRVIWQHRAPQPDGVYTDVRSYRQTGALPVLSGQVDIARVLRHA